MNIIKQFLALLTLILFINGCVHQVNKEGLTLSLDESQLSESFKDKFPIKQEFVFGKVEINKPLIDIPKNSKRINTKIALRFTTMFTNALSGNFSISGEPFFDKKEASIYLQNIKIENFALSNFKIDDKFSKTFLITLKPMIDKVFKKFPIYRIPKESFHGNFIKNIKIKEEKLLITYGI